MWRAGQRLKKHIEAGQTPIIFHFGDHDPSGKDMSRDILDRLTLFLTTDLDLDNNDAYFNGEEETPFEFKRLALTMDQIDEFDPPPNPAKITDSRADAYIAEFGTESWELDALEPKVIAALIEKAMGSVRDDDKYEEALKREAAHCYELESVSSKWDDIVNSLR
jgi:hypothetical protein